MQGENKNTNKMDNIELDTMAPVGNAGQSENIQVFIRIRPLIAREKLANANGNAAIQSIGDNTIKVTTTSAAGNGTIQCKYDAVFDPTYTQERVYDRVKECTEAVLNGFNSTLFAYGQTSSGKSFTMFGAEGDTSKFGTGKTVSPTAGIIPRAIRDIFEGTSRKNVKVYCSFVQIYNENIYDLLRDTKRDTPLQIHEDHVSGIYVEGLSEYNVRSVQDCLDLLQSGEDNRAVRATHMNQVSSRSHSVFQLLIERHEENADHSMGTTTSTIKSKFNMVDLAGSEKWSMDAEMGSMHISEMNNINLSLHTLGRCIASLSSKSAASSTHHVPYRDSKLTRLLQDSLGGNTKTRIIATLSPSSDSVDESISTLKFADRAKQVMVVVKVNKERDIDPAYVEKLENEIRRLKSLLSAFGGDDGSNPEQPATSTENERIQKLQALVLQLSDENKHLRETTSNTPLPSVAAVAPTSKSFSLPQLSNNAPPAAADLNPAVVECYQEQIQEYDTVFSKMKSLMGKFFTFEVEEDDLKSGIESLFKQYKSVKRSAPISSTPSLPSTLKSPGAVKLIKPGRGLITSNNASPFKPKKDNCAIRVRGKGGEISTVDANQTLQEAPVNAIQLELANAKKSMMKQAKLQAWLIEKEKRELEKIQQEQAYIDEQRKMMSDRDAKFHKRNKAVKAKLRRPSDASENDVFL